MTLLKTLRHLRSRLRRPASVPVLQVGLVALLFGASAAGTQAVTAQPLKVRIGTDGRTFQLENGKRFVPFGVTYYRPGTGWAPQVWKQFDPEATRRDFAKMKQLGVNCVRVFLSFGSFYSEPGQLQPEGLAKFDQFLAIAEEFGIYVHPTGPDHWEGPPHWRPVTIEDEKTLSALESFWRLFAARYRGRHVIFAYDLKNEPELGWDSHVLGTRWNLWLEKKYLTTESLRHAWGETNAVAWGTIGPPGDSEALKSRRLLDYQSFREEIADEWTRRQVSAIKSADPDALVTVGFIQWSVPCLLPGSVHFYSAFRPQRQARFLDFLEIHFYPFANGAYEYRNEADEAANLAYLEGVVREVARPGKPVVVAEFGWYGGGKPKFDRGAHPAASEDQQARYCRRVVEVSAPYATGWLNWGFYDQPEATDCSELTGLLTAGGAVKAWGKMFAELAAHAPAPVRAIADWPARPSLDWDACLSSTGAEKDFRQRYLEAFVKAPFGRPP